VARPGGLSSLINLKAGVQFPDPQQTGRKNMNIKNMVMGGKTVSFIHFVNNELWYKTECGFEFPVPIEDAGNATFLNVDKAILFMRYIRKHIKFLAQATEDN